MKTRISLLALITVSAFWLTSCEKDDNETAKPQINNVEVGYQNSKKATLGNDLHVEAEMIAEGKISKVQVTLHPAGEEETKSSSTSWEFDSTYTEFSGLKNATFHKHIVIPVTADTGSYHFHIFVTDMEGNQTELEDEDVRIEKPTDTTAPVITVSAAPSSNQAFSNGQSITISGTVTDDIFLGGFYIGLVHADQNLTDALVSATNTITMLHTHDFGSPTSYSFSATINVGTTKDNNSTPKDITGDIAWKSGNYYIVVKSKDAFGGNWTFSAHYPIVINL